jgi:hypothetical protein
MMIKARISPNHRQSKREAEMFICWRVQQDLSCLKEILLFHDPGLIRCCRQWVRCHAAAIALAEAL